MQKTTQKIQDELETDFVINFLQSMMHTEISNHLSREADTLFINLSNHKTARVMAPKVPRETPPPTQIEATVHNIATLLYITHHNYGYGIPHKKIKKLYLHNLDECRTYLEDAVTSQLNAYFTNYLIEFMNGEKFMLSVELKK